MSGAEFGKYFTANERGHLEIEGHDCVDLADEFGTPLYIISENTIRLKYRHLYEAFKSRYPNNLILYSVKSNNGLAIRRILQQEGAGMECHGIGELYSSLMLGVDPKKISLDGANKSDEELRAATNAGVFVAVDNLEDLDRLNTVAGKLGEKANVNPRLRTAFTSPNNKNGMDAKVALEACKRAIKYENIRLTGVMVHTTSQAPVSTFEKETDEVFEFIAQVKEKFNYNLEFADLGSGFAVGRKEGHGRGGKDKIVPRIEEYVEAIASKAREKIDEYGLNEPTIITESGRYFVTNAGVLLCRVGNIKELPIKGFTKKVFVDASFNLMMRIETYRDWYYHIILGNKANAPLEEIVDIGGCTSFGGPPDILGINRNLPRITHGDVVAILDLGGYAESTTTQYNSIPRPASLLLCGDKVEVIRRRETPYDVFSRDIIPYWLLNNSDKGVVKV